MHINKVNLHPIQKPKCFLSRNTDRIRSL